MWLVNVLVLLGTALLAFYAYAQYMFRYWKRRGVQQTQMVFPFGSLKGVSKINNIGAIIKNKYNESKGLPYYGLNMFLTSMLLIRDPALVKEVLVKEFTNFHDRGFYFNTEKEPLTNHLFFLSGKKWRNLRIKMTPTFTSGKMKMMFPTMLQSSQEMQEYLEKPAERGEVLEMKELFDKFTTNIIARSAFGLELDCFKNPNAEFRHFSQFFFKPNLMQSIITTLNFTFSKLMYHVPIYLIPKNVSKFFIGVVEDTMKYREENNEQRNDFMQLLIELKNKGRLEDAEAHRNRGTAEQISSSEDDSRKFTMSEAAAQAFIFFAAGHETASTLLQFCLFELALNPDIQAKLRQEIDTVLAKNEGKMTYEAIQEMTYLEQVISETLRKYPANAFLIREVGAPFKMPDSDLVLEKGRRIVISIMGLQHDPEYFPEPEKFNPDRFSPSNKEKIKPYTYIPFGEGPRICIGMRFGMMQTKTGLAQFLSKYRAEPSDQTPIPPLKFDPKALLMALQDGMYLKITKR